jgi:hypothetical protein
LSLENLNTLRVENREGFKVLLPEYEELLAIALTSYIENEEM